jgi:hypothetical protein
LTRAMLYVLIDACERSERLRPSQEWILESYQRFRASWTATSHQHTAIIPLLNFTTALSEPIQISPHFEITPLTDPRVAQRVAMGDQGYANGNLVTILVVMPACMLRGRKLVPTRVVA